MKNILFILFLAVLIGCKTESKVETVSIKDDVSFLASDKLEGRQTGSDGEKAAADYIASRFKNLRLEAKGTDRVFSKIYI